MNENYEVLRHLTTPVVALTCRRDDKLNGMIANSAMRASLSPDRPMVSAYVHKFNLSHDIIFGTERFVMHLLHRNQFELMYTLGFQSGRDSDKFAGIDYRIGSLGLPILADCYSWMECEVVNAMDTGGSTCFLGAVRDMGRGPGRDVMDSDYMREHMPEEWKQQYLVDLERAQQWITDHAGPPDPEAWARRTRETP